MAIKIITTFVRPNTGVAFWKYSDATKAHVVSTYPAIDATVTFTDSPDGLSRVVSRTFADQAAVDAWKADPVIVAAKDERNLYCATHEIAFTNETVTV